MLTILRKTVRMKMIPLNNTCNDAVFIHLDIAALRNCNAAAYDEKLLPTCFKTQETIRETIDLLDRGKLRLAESWQRNWVGHKWQKKQFHFISASSRSDAWKLVLSNSTLKFPLKKTTSGWVSRLFLRVLPATEPILLRGLFSSLAMQTSALTWIGKP